MEQYREIYLLEMIRWSGRGDFRTAKQCPDCLAQQAETPGEPRFRCLECALPNLVCSSCCMKRHKLHPFHWIQVCGYQTLIRTITHLPCLSGMGPEPLRTQVTEVAQIEVSAGTRQHVLRKRYSVSCRYGRSAYQRNTSRCNRLLRLLERSTPSHTTAASAALSRIAAHSQDLRDLLSSSTTPQTCTGDEGIHLRLLSLTGTAN